MSGSTTSSSTSSSKGRNPVLLIIVGCALLFFWVLGTLLQLQTSEAFILHASSIVKFVPRWDVLLQPLDFAQGKLTPDMTKAVMWAWGCELAFIVCMVGYEVAHDGILGANRKLAPWFRTGVIALFAFDVYTDFQYGTMASGIWGQLAFALITAFIAMFFAIIGVRFIEAAVYEWRR